MLDQLYIPWQGLVQLVNESTLIGFSGIAALLYLVLVIVAYTKYNLYHQVTDRWLIAGLALAVVHEFLNITTQLTLASKILFPLILQALSPIIQYALLTTGLICISTGYLQYWQRQDGWCRRYAITAITTTLMLCLLCGWRWSSISVLNPSALFSHSGYAALLSANTILWLGLAIYFLASAPKNRQHGVGICLLALFALSQGWQLIRVWSDAWFLMAGVHVTYLVAVLLLSYDYLTENSLAGKKTVQALCANEAKLATLLNTMTDMVWLKSPDGVYLACNAKFEQFLALKKAPLWVKPTTIL